MSGLDIFSLFMNLSLRYNPTGRGTKKNTKINVDIPKLSSRNFTEHKLDYTTCVNKTEEIITSNISNVNSKNVAIGLSGGTDSSLNALLLAKNEKVNLKLFCIGFNDIHDEFKDARLIAKLTNCDYKEIIIEDLISDMPNLIWIFGQPKSNLWPYYNFQAVKKLGAKTTLSGEGGDELFGGYYFRYKLCLKKIPRTPLEKAKTYLFSRPRDYIPNQIEMFGKNFKMKNKLIYNYNDMAKFFVPSFTNNLAYINQIFLADFNYKLRYDFNYVDSIFAKKLGIKLVSPFLQSSLINFATHIPYKYKLNKFTSKIILRDMLKRNHAPKKIYEKPKQGWGMRPSIIWKRGLEDRCKRFLLDGYLARDGWIDKQWLKESYARIESKKSSESIYPLINKLWDILSLEVYYLQKILKNTKNGKISNW